MSTEFTLTTFTIQVQAENSVHIAKLFSVDSCQKAGIRGKFCEEPVERGPSPCLTHSWGFSLAAETGDVTG